MNPHKTKRRKSKGPRRCAGLLTLADYNPELVGRQPDDSRGLMAAIVENSRGKPSMPKGKIENGETPEDAAIREGYEEANIVVEGAVVHLGRYIRESKRRQCLTIIDVEGTVLEDPKALDPNAEDTISAEWVTLDELVERLETHPEAAGFVLTLFQEFGVLTEGPPPMPETPTGEQDNFDLAA